MSEIKLELAESVYTKLEQEAIERGITIEELLRWIAGEHTRFTGPIPLTARALPPIPDLSELADGAKTSQNAMKLSLQFMKAAVRQGNLKCPECTMPLSLEDIENGKCSSCGAEV